MTSHLTCIGSGVWKLSRCQRVATPNILFIVVSGDPTVALELVTSGFGIAVLPLWMAKRADIRNRLSSVLPQWSPEPITLCALFSGPSRMTPKVHALLEFLDKYLGTDRVSVDNTARWLEVNNLRFGIVGGRRGYGTRVTTLNS